MLYIWYAAQVCPHRTLISLSFTYLHISLVQRSSIIFPLIPSIIVALTNYPHHSSTTYLHLRNEHSHIPSLNQYCYPGNLARWPTRFIISIAAWDHELRSLPFGLQFALHVLSQWSYPTNGSMRSYIEPISLSSNLLPNRESSKLQLRPRFYEPSSYQIPSQKAIFIVLLLSFPIYNKRVLIIPTNHNPRP